MLCVVEFFMSHEEIVQLQLIGCGGILTCYCMYKLLALCSFDTESVVERNSVTFQSKIKHKKFSLRWKKGLKLTTSYLTFHQCNINVRLCQFVTLVLELRVHRLRSRLDQKHKRSTHLTLFCLSNSMQPINIGIEKKVFCMNKLEYLLICA